MRERRPEGGEIDRFRRKRLELVQDLGAHSAAVAMLGRRHAHPWCDARIDFGPILARIKASRTG